jgi:hypothetical protein
LGPIVRRSSDWAPGTFGSVRSRRDRRARPADDLPRRAFTIHSLTPLQQAELAGLIDEISSP